MFRKPFLLATTLLLIGGVALVISLTRVTDADRIAYDKLMAETKFRAPTPTSPAKQKKRGITRDLWLANGLHVHLESPSSHLSFDAGEAVEQMDSVSGIIHGEELYTIEAKNAVYHYNSNRFVAETVALSKFDDEGTLLSSGTARFATATLNDFSAQDLSAVVDEMDVSSDHVHYDGEKYHLTGNVHIKDEEGRELAANQVIIDRRENRVQGIGSVRMTLSEPQIAKLREGFGGKS